MILWDPDFKKAIKTYELTNQNLTPDSRGTVEQRSLVLLDFCLSVGMLTEPVSCVRAVTLTRRIVVGTRGGEICEIEKDGRIRVRVQGNFTLALPRHPTRSSSGHAEGEMWALSTHPLKYEICTASDDKTVRIWSLTDRRMLRWKKLESLLRTCQYSQDGKSIAVGTKDGRKSSSFSLSLC